MSKQSHYKPTIVFPEMATVKEAAEVSHLAVYRIRQLYKTGKIRYVTCGRHVLINLQSLKEYMEIGDAPLATQDEIRGIRKIV